MNASGEQHARWPDVPGVVRRVRRPMAFAILFALVIAACTIGGMAVGLLTASSDHQETSFGTLETRVHPDLDGHVTVYVPLVDWRVNLLENRAPASIEIELRGIDREQAGIGLSSAGAASRSLDVVRADSERVVEQAVRRGALVSSIGGMIGAIVAGALLAALRLRRRWLVIAPMFGAAMIALVLVPSVRAMQGLGAQHIAVTSAGGHADELPVVLRFAEQLLDVGPEYAQLYETALRSISNLASFTGTDRVEPDATAVVISDLHDNVFVLDALDAFAGDSTVFGVGDFVQVGARIEERTASRVAALGSGLVAVSGNHDTPRYMESLAEEGAIVLDAEEPTTEIEGLQVAGWPDPLERSEESRGEHRLRVYGEAYKQQREAFVEWWTTLEQRPDIVLVHQHGIAHHLLRYLDETGDTEPLVILTGHDHEPHVHVEGPHAIVDAGTIGAGGLVAIGEQEASFARLEITRGRVTAVVVVSIEPLTGAARSSRTSLFEKSR